MTQTLSHTSILTVLLDVSTGTATLKRSGERPETPQHLETAYLDALELLSSREVRGVLVDSRDAAGRNSADYEAVMLAITIRIVSDYARCAVLVKTAAGTLQARRMLSTAQGRSGQLLISDDPDECDRFLVS